MIVGNIGNGTLTVADGGIVDVPSSCDCGGFRFRRNCQHWRWSGKSGGSTWHVDGAKHRVWLGHRHAQLQSHVRRLRVRACDQRRRQRPCARRHDHLHWRQHLLRAARHYQEVPLQIAPGLGNLGAPSGGLDLRQRRLAHDGHIFDCPASDARYWRWHLRDASRHHIHLRWRHHRQRRVDQERRPARSS